MADKVKTPQVLDNRMLLGNMLILASCFSAAVIVRAVTYNFCTLWPVYNMEMKLTMKMQDSSGIDYETDVI